MHGLDVQVPSFGQHCRSLRIPTSAIAESRWSCGLCSEYEVRPALVQDPRTTPPNRYPPIDPASVGLGLRALHFELTRCGHSGIRPSMQERAHGGCDYAKNVYPRWWDLPPMCHPARAATVECRGSSLPTVGDSSVSWHAA